MFAMRLSVSAAFAVALIAIVAGGGGVLAQQSDRVPVDRKTTEQKATFVEHLVTKSVAVATIESSGDASAVANLEKARTLVTDARKELDGGDFKVANEILDEALAIVNKETRRLSKTRVGEKRTQEAYDRRLQSVKTFLEAYERVGGEENRTAAIDAEIKRINNLVGQAEAIAADGRIEEAKSVLDQAYLATRSNIKGLRQGTTLTRSLNFETAEEEYAYEIDRNESHFMLLNLALQRQPVAGSMMGRIDDLRGSAKQHRSGAESHAAKGAYAPAIDSLNQSTGALLKAIRMTGLFIPG
jgi:hypothetical protein